MNQTKQTKAEKTRRYIIEQTAPIFNTKGYAGTSLTDMTVVTGLTKGSIYGNFENKDEVAIAAFDYNFERVTQYLKEAILQHEDAIERLMVYPKTYRQFLQIPFLKTGCPILNTSTEADDTHQGLRQKAAEALAFWKTSLENQVKRGIARFEINPETDPTQVAVILIFMIEGAIMQAKVKGDDQELQIAMDFLTNYIQGLKNRPEASDAH